MKIKEVFQGNPSILGSKRLDKKELKEVDFEKVLSEASAKLKLPSSMAASPLSSVPPLNDRSMIDLSQIRFQSIQATEDTLALLEAYQKAMADPEVSLKKIDSFIQALSDQVADLQTLSEKVPSTDPLNRIMTEVGIVSAVEIEKFRKGELI
ncbi:MAG: hypothetical protein ACUVWO_06165 [Thermodesulfobacteriota bacterium]